jgi:heme/copper-type cytochrome/quinol oxidase subunit 2
LADVIVSVVLLLSFVGLALLRVSPKFDNSLVWLIISMNCVVVLSCVVGMLVLFAVNLWKFPGNVQQYEQIPD